MTGPDWFGIGPSDEPEQPRSFSAVNNRTQHRSTDEATVADVVLTPPNLAAQMVRSLSIAAGSKVCDPCLGQGAFFDAFDPSWDSHWCEIALGVDFLSCQDTFDWCISNPPFSLAKEWLLHSAKVCREGFAYILPLHSLTAHRLGLLEDLGWHISSLLIFPSPPGWPGFQHGFISWSRDAPRPAPVRLLREALPGIQTTLDTLQQPASNSSRAGRPPTGGG